MDPHFLGSWVPVVSVPFVFRTAEVSSQQADWVFLRDAGDASTHHLTVLSQGAVLWADLYEIFHTDTFIIGTQPATQPEGAVRRKEKKVTSQPVPSRARGGGFNFLKIVGKRKSRKLSIV
ncbi:hypothetical protein CDAR_294551 [Caerostris darwini]|uniref:Uncharacterized protein n=1 Tax=Caerostris darwini TaxID=1538125 RepID=A0AAV4UK83_9ARAC|nr:hypothetical protein CDAR_294551 [Caerostris darwini]